MGTFTLRLHEEEVGGLKKLHKEIPLSYSIHTTKTRLSTV